MHENVKPNHGSQVFERFLGSEKQTTGAYETSDSRNLRISFEKRDGQSLSVAYGRLSLVRHYKHAIYVSLGEHAIRIQGDRLRPLYEALHQEQVVRVIEQPTTAGEDFIDPDQVAATTLVRKINWPDELCMEG
ncbi:hypothetical protein [Bythopirellula goksoeyrii]|uniref:Uncharacterized protein n=1 Tax=Bythopirellula goksoeyrii TaxID=1400387 RepID=A0A5B9QEU4_9BACT|nr:hypothetical protein [Bythopirellula goksoeyrii]QEG36160.1 hypothetical protein Pr1d_34690 [Bythopirellula goksoeyrii]